MRTSIVAVLVVVALIVGGFGGIMLKQPCPIVINSTDSEKAAIVKEQQKLCADQITAKDLELAQCRKSREAAFDIKETNQKVFRDIQDLMRDLNVSVTNAVKDYNVLVTKIKVDVNKSFYDLNKTIKNEC